MFGGSGPSHRDKAAMNGAPRVFGIEGIFSTMSKRTNPSLFIIESLEFSDEEDGQFEGRVLRDILEFSDTRAEYYYVRTRKELQVVLRKFFDSNHRYLHISCHGNSEAVALTLDYIGYKEFASDIKGLLYKRRLFFSACGVVNRRLAKAILPRSGCFSLIGPSATIGFGDAVLMWATFYHLIFRDLDDGGMKGGKIRWALRRLEKTFGKRFAYFRPGETLDGVSKVNVKVR